MLDQEEFGEDDILALRAEVEAIRLKKAAVSNQMDDRLRDLMGSEKESARYSVTVHKPIVTPLHSS